MSVAPEGCGKKLLGVSMILCGARKLEAGGRKEEGKDEARERKSADLSGLSRDAFQEHKGLSLALRSQMQVRFTLPGCPVSTG